MSLSYLKSKQLFPKKTPSTHGRTYLRMCGHWFCLWILRNWQHLFNFCGVKGLSKLQSAPSICRDKEGKRQTNRTFCSSFPMLERLIWTSTQRQTKRPESTKEMDRIWFRPIHPFTYSSNQNSLVPFPSVNALSIAEAQGTMKDHERPKVMVNGHEWPWLAMNDHKWRRCMPWTSHLPSNTIPNQPLASQLSTECSAHQGLLSSVFGLSCTTCCSFLWSWQRGPILLAHMVLTCAQTHMNEHISAWICHISHNVYNCFYRKHPAPMAGPMCGCVAIGSVSTGAVFVFD